MKISILNDELNKKFTSDYKKSIHIQDLEKYIFRKIFSDQINQDYTFKFYDIDEKRILESHETLKNRKELNLKLIKSKTINKASKCESFMMADLITKVTGATKKLPINNNKVKIIKNNISKNIYESESLVSSIPLINMNNSFPYISNEINTIQNFVESFQNVEVDQTHLNTLIEMGFQMERANVALMISRNNLIQAGDLLINQNFEDIFSTVINQRTVNIIIIF